MDSNGYDTDPIAAAARMASLGDQHVSLRDKVTEAIREAILSGRYRPGDRLVEERLAVEFGVSRNPVREAVLRLAAEGLIEINARRGASVTSLSPREAAELLEIRATLEGATAKMVARRGDPAVAARLRALLQHGDAALESDRFAALNEEYHDILAGAGQNRMLAELMRSLRDRTSPLFAGLPSPRLREGWQEHARIIRAILDGDDELAALLAYRHVMSAGAAAGKVLD